MLAAAAFRTSSGVGIVLLLPFAMQLPRINGDATDVTSQRSDRRMGTGLPDVGIQDGRMAWLSCFDLERATAVTGAGALAMER